MATNSIINFSLKIVPLTSFRRTNDIDRLVFPNLQYCYHIEVLSSLRSISGVVNALEARNHVNLRGT
jgi:hypothetical protein